MAVVMTFRPDLHLCDQPGRPDRTAHLGPRRRHPARVRGRASDRGAARQPARSGAGRLGPAGIGGAAAPRVGVCPSFREIPPGGSRFADAGERVSACRVADDLAHRPGVRPFSNGSSRRSAPASRPMIAPRCARRDQFLRNLRADPDRRPDIHVAGQFPVGGVRRRVRSGGFRRTAQPVRMGRDRADSRRGRAGQIPGGR